MQFPARYKSLSLQTCLVLALSIVFFRFVYPPVNILSWDVFGYYLYLPARFIYHDVGMHDMGWVKGIFDKYQVSDSLYQVYAVSGDGWVIKYSMGLALLNAPAFFIANALAGILGYPADGFSLPYQYSFAISGLVWAIAGIFMFRKVLRLFFDELTSGILLILIVLGTNYFQLTAFDGMLTHNYLFTLYTFIVWFTIKWHRQPKASTATWLGLFLGLAILTRPSELVCLLIPLLWGIHDKESLADKWNTVSVHWKHLFFLALTLVLAGLPQLMYWKSVTAHWLYYSYNNPGEGFEFFRPYTLQVLFSFRKGWLVYTPVMAAALAGFYFLYRRNKPLFPVIVLYFLVNMWVVSSWTCWWYAGGSYSQRTLLSSYVLLALPLGYLVDAARKARTAVRIVLFASLSLMVILNIFQTWQWAHGILDKTRMTRAYYFAIFGKTSVPDADRSLLMIDRAAEEILPTHLDHFNYRELSLHTYENSGEDPGRLVKDTAFSGEYSLKLLPGSPFASGLEISFKDLTKREYAWLRVSVWVYPMETIDKIQASLVASFEYNGEAYKYTAESVAKEKYHVLPFRWTKVSFDYLTPETRSPDDKLKVYFWLQGNAPVLIDDLKVEMWEPVN